MSWVFNVTQQDLRRRFVVLVFACTGTFEISDELFKTLLEHVVAQIHNEIVIAQKLVGDQHAVRQAEGFILRNVSNFDTELAAIADRRFDFFARRADNDANFANACSCHRFYSIKQDRLIRNWYKLFGARMSNWS